MEKKLVLNHEIVMASSDKATNNFITKMKKEGRLVKIAAKVYTTNLNDTVENIIRRNLFFILGELFPDAVLSHRSAFECRPAHSRYHPTRNRRLPLFQTPGTHLLKTMAWYSQITVSHL